MVLKNWWKTTKNYLKFRGNLNVRKIRKYLILRQGYTIVITKDNIRSFQGHYNKKWLEERTFELPKEELKIFNYLSNINSLLSSGNILRVSMLDKTFKAQITTRKKDYEYQDAEYLEVYGENEGLGYCDCLINLNEKLYALSFPKEKCIRQYKKS